MISGLFFKIIWEGEKTDGGMDEAMLAIDWIWGLGC